MSPVVDDYDSYNKKKSHKEITLNAVRVPANFRKNL
jgi:hypothetical protein